MRLFSTLPFSEAILKQPGEYVCLGGVARKVIEVRRTGRDEPYFRLDGVPNDHWLSSDGFISWQVLGDAKPE